MPVSANVSLSAFEKQLVTDANFILTKNTIIQKVQFLFGELSQAYQGNALVQTLPQKVLIHSPKISRGENYEGLPYVMLDYPRCFGKEDVFAIRTFFWWGHFFSCTLQLKGMYTKQFLPQLLQHLNNGKMNGLWINKTEEEWMHQMNDTHMQEIKPGATINLSEKNVIKISAKICLHEWDNAAALLQGIVNQLLSILQSTAHPVK